jgi:hypothetical protein
VVVGDEDTEHEGITVHARSEVCFLGRSFTSAITVTPAEYFRSTNSSQQSCAASNAARRHHSGGEMIVLMATVQSGRIEQVVAPQEYGLDPMCLRTKV